MVEEAIINYKSVITSVLRTCFCAYFPPTLNLANDSRSLALSPALQLSIYVNLLWTISRYACCCASVQNLKCVASLIYWLSSNDALNTLVDFTRLLRSFLLFKHYLNKSLHHFLRSSPTQNFRIPHYYASVIIGRSSTAPSSSSHGHYVELLVVRS
jgi:hypothetical protein